MEKEIIWDRKARENIKGQDYDGFDDFLTAIDYFNDNKVDSFITEEAYADTELWEWLYSRDDSEFNDLKKELINKLERAKKISEANYQKKESVVGTNNKIKVLIAGSSETVFHFLSLSEAMNGLRAYLLMESKADFSNDLRECFLHLYFVRDIGSTINTLHRKFDEIKEEIVEHLCCLDDYQKTFEKMVEDHKSNREMCMAFQGDNSIECSPQAGRDSVKDLKLTLFNQDTKQDEEIVCELHTKFKKFNIDRTKQDRIYFFPGRKGIESGKVIIKHIGKHL